MKNHMNSCCHDTNDTSITPRHMCNGTYHHSFSWLCLHHFAITQHCSTPSFQPVGFHRFLQQGSVHFSTPVSPIHPLNVHYVLEDAVCPEILKHLQQTSGKIYLQMDVVFVIIVQGGDRRVRKSNKSQTRI